MGVCVSKPPKSNPYSVRLTEQQQEEENNHDSLHPSQIPKTPLTPHRNNDDVIAGKQSPFFPLYSPSPAHFLKKSPATPRRFFRRPFPPPSPAKHIKAVLARRQRKKATSAIPEEEEEEEESVDLDKKFGFSKEFTSRLEVGDEIGRGHFGYTCSARFKKGERKGQQVAVKVIPKVKVNPIILLLLP